MVEAASVPPQPAEVAKPAEPAAAQPSAPVSIPAPATASASSEQPAAAASPSSAAPAAPCPNPSRCNLAECRKKVGLTGFKCKCGLVFCGQHRYAEAHNCTFDYVSDGRLKLAANNPVVSAAKVAKI